MTIVWSASMSAMPAMGEMAMPGGWTMSMMWTRMPEQTWAGAAASFLAMWTVMTIAMMLPSLAPALRRYHLSVRRVDAMHAPRLTALVGLGYLSVWTALGAAAFPVGVALARIAMQRPTLAGVAPIAVGVIILVAGVVQHSAWKARHLVCCREERWHDDNAPASTGAAWRQGVRFGLHCIYSCSGPMAILFAVGIMNLRVMAVVGAVVTLERLAPAGVRIARIGGTIAIGGGIVLIVRAAGLG